MDWSKQDNASPLSWCQVEDEAWLLSPNFAQPVHNVQLWNHQEPWTTSMSPLGHTQRAQTWASPSSTSGCEAWYGNEDGEPHSRVTNPRMSPRSRSDMPTSGINKTDPALSQEERKRQGWMRERRRQQNRQSQRAFRERKEKRLKELEDNLVQAESRQSTLEKDVERLKQEMMVLTVENELLRAIPPSSPCRTCTDHLSKPSPTSPSPQPIKSLEQKEDGKMSESKVLSCLSTFEMIQNQVLAHGGRLKVGHLRERVKQLAQRHESRDLPIFEARDIWALVGECLE